MKRIAVLLTALLLLAGCADKRTEAADTSASAAQTTPSAPSPDENLLTVVRPDLMIYEEPGYDYCETGVLLDPGQYAIAEEAVDAEGIRWGKLASGGGWIDLDKAAKEAHVLLTMESANERTIGGDEYHEAVLSSSEYAVKLLFRAQETLTDLSVTTMDFSADGLFPAGELYSMDALTPEMPLVLTVAFPGDLTTYGLLYTDEAGKEHTCILYQSGRNGAIVLQEKE